MSTPENILLPENFIAVTGAVADIEHDYLGRCTGQDGKVAALDEGELYRQAITSLTSPESSILTALDNAELEAMDLAKHNTRLPDTPTFALLGASTRFLHILDELYGEIDGYKIGPTPIALASLSIQAGEFFTESGAVIIDTTIGKDGLEITKSRRWLNLLSDGGGGQGHESLPANPQDLAIVARAVSQLANITPVLRQRTEIE